MQKRRGEAGGQSAPPAVSPAGAGVDTDGESLVMDAVDEFPRWARSVCPYGHTLEWRDACKHERCNTCGGLITAKGGLALGCSRQFCFAVCPRHACSSKPGWGA